MEKYTLDFKATNGYPSRCRITIYREIQLVVASETGEGMSVTNAAEIIATEVARQFGLNPQRMLFIEHYPEDQRPQPYGESYDLVTFTWNGVKARNPNCRHLSPAEVDEILQSMND